MAGAAGPQLQLHGERVHGADVRTQNTTAVLAVANILKTSLGPVGLDKVGPAAGAARGLGRPGGAAAAPPPPVLAARAEPEDGPGRRAQMLVDDIGDVTITNDGATILKLLEVEHPAAKVRGAAVMRPAGAGQRAQPPARHRQADSGAWPPLQILVELAELQDQEVGDGTTSVVIVAAELLKRATDLVRSKIHPTSIISGYRLAMREVRAGGRAGLACRAAPQGGAGAARLPTPPARPAAPAQACKYIEENLAIDTSTLGKETLMNAAKTAMSSKIVGADSDFFGQLVVDAVTAVKSTNEITGKVRGARPAPARLAAGPWRPSKGGGGCGCHLRMGRAASQSDPAPRRLRPAGQVPGQRHQHPEGTRQERAGKQAAGWLRPQPGPLRAGVLAQKRLRRSQQPAWPGCPTTPHIPGSSSARALCRACPSAWPTPRLRAWT